MFSKTEIIEIGRLLEAVDVFNNRITMNIIPDAKVPDRKYVQVRSSARLTKGKRIWLGKYVGKEGCYTPEDLAKAKESLKKRCYDFVNQELSKYNCKVEDFK